MRRLLRRPKHPTRSAVVLVLLAMVLAVVRSASRRRPAMRRVAADLRSPVLFLPIAPRRASSLRAVRSMPIPPIPVPSSVTVASRQISTPTHDPVRVVVYERRDRARPSGALVWIHGGGFVLGQPEQGNELCGRWADELGLLVVSVDYRLAPEHPFPAGLEDCYAALCWVRDHAEVLGVDLGRLAVGGDSAGGGLAAALSQLARDRGGPAIAFQLLEYPMLDDRTVMRRDHAGTGDFVWTPAHNRFGWTAYLGHPPTTAPLHPYAAPGRTEDLAGLAPAWIGVGELDLFHAEDVAYADALRAAGVPCELHVQPGMYHGADSILSKRPTSRAFRDRMTTALADGIAVSRRSPGGS
jgi:acetyl esterase/lipase